MSEGVVTYHQLEGLLRAAKIPNDEGTIRWLWGNLGGNTKEDQIPRKVFEQVMSQIRVEDVAPRASVPQPIQRQDVESIVTEVGFSGYRNITPPRRCGSTTPARRQIATTPRSHLDSTSSVGYKTALSSPPTVHQHLVNQSVTIRNLEEKISQYEASHTTPTQSPYQQQVGSNSLKYDEDTQQSIESNDTNTAIVTQQAAMIKLLEQTLQNERSRRPSDTLAISPTGRGGYADNHIAVMRHQQKVKIKELEDSLQQERRRTGTPSRSKPPGTRQATETRRQEYSHSPSPKAKHIARQAEEIRRLEAQLESETNSQTQTQTAASQSEVDRRHNAASPGREVERLSRVVRTQAEELSMLREAYELLQRKTTEVEMQAADNAEVAEKLAAAKKYLNQRERELSTYEEQGAGIQQELDGEGAKLQRERTELNRLRASLAEREHIIERMKEHATDNSSSIKSREIEVAQREAEMVIAEGRIKRREQSLVLRENSVSESERNLYERDQSLQDAIRQFNSKAPQPQTPLVVPVRQNQKGTPAHFCSGDSCPLHRNPQDMQVPSKKVNLLQKQNSSGFDKQRLAAEQNELLTRKLRNREAVLEEREAAAAERELKLVHAQEMNSNLPQQVNSLREQQLAFDTERDELDAKEAKLVSLEREIETQLHEYAGVKGKIAEMKALERAINEKQRGLEIAENDFNDRLAKLNQRDTKEKKEWNTVAKKSRAMEAELRDAQEKLENQERIINRRMRDTDTQHQKTLKKLKQREEALAQKETGLVEKENLIAEGKNVLDKIATEQMKKDDGIAERNTALEEGEEILRNAIVSVLPGTSRGALLSLGVDELASKASELIRASAGVLRNRDEQHSAQAATVEQQTQSLIEREAKLNSKQADIEKQAIELKQLKKQAESKEVELLQEELKVLTEKESVSIRLEEVEMREQNLLHRSCRLSTTSATG